jgi:uncharacterized protein (TIGR02147 family)
MQTQATNYRDYLREILIEKKKTNPLFSLRSFARTLGIQPAFLSYVLSGKRDLSDEMILQFAERLNLSAPESKIFELLVKLERTKNASLKLKILDSLKILDPNRSEQRDISVDHFMMISEWYHYALFMLLDISDFEWSTANAAKAIGISTFEVESALKRLAALELIEITATQKPKKLEKRILVQTEVQNDALRKYNTQIFEKAKTALENFAPPTRFNGNETIVLSESQLDEANAIFEECFNKMIELSHRKTKNKQVYQVGTYLYPLSQIKVRKGETK